MIIFSQKIILFINELKQIAQAILREELGLKVSGERFYDRQKRISYPLKIVIYNNKSMLGYFDSEFYEMGFHERLMYTKKEQLKNLVRHELAHYMIFNQYGSTVAHHGVEFRALCQSLGWSEEVYRATTCLEGNQEGITEENAILRKVKKLMALANSANQNEAEQAMIKSQQLLLMNNLDAVFLKDESEEKISLKRIIRQKKENAKMRSIATILNTFLVNTVYTRTENYTYLEVIGSQLNLEIAEYVSEVLNVELEKLWKQAQKQTDLKGLIAKNSFFLGIAKGYCNKVQALKKEYSFEMNQALMVLEKKLVDAKSLVYRRLYSNKRRSGYCLESSNLGEKMGRELTIKPAIKNSSANPIDYLVHLK